jgi:tetratricopeptide (TPR) repeat protein
MKAAAMRAAASKDGMKKLFLVVLGCCAVSWGTAAGLNELSAARDRQDLAALDRAIADSKGAAADAKAAEAQYKLALANSYAAEVAMELRDKKKSEAYAEAGMEPAQKALADNGGNAEYHRLMGQLCGQVIPANPLMGALKFGPCARDEITKALQLNDKLALAYVSRGVGNYYLPASMGGGVDEALKDFDKAAALDPKLSDAYLWKGITLRKANRNAEARKALEQALQMNPGRLWAKQQLEKIPAQ